MHVVRSRPRFMKSFSVVAGCVSCCVSAGGVVANAGDELTSPPPSAIEMASRAMLRIRRMFTSPSCHFMPPNADSGVV